MYEEKWVIHLYLLFLFHDIVVSRSNEFRCFLFTNRFAIFFIGAGSTDMSLDRNGSAHVLVIFAHLNFAYECLTLNVSGFSFVYDSYWINHTATKVRVSRGRFNVKTRGRTFASCLMSRSCVFFPHSHFVDKALCYIKFIFSKCRTNIVDLSIRDTKGRTLFACTRLNL